MASQPWGGLDPKLKGLEDLPSMVCDKVNRNLTCNAPDGFADRDRANMEPLDFRRATMDAPQANWRTWSGTSALQEKLDDLRQEAQQEFRGVRTPGTRGEGNVAQKPLRRLDRRWGPGEEPRVLFAAHLLKRACKPGNSPRLGACLPIQRSSGAARATRKTGGRGPQLGTESTDPVLAPTLDVIGDGRAYDLRATRQRGKETAT